MTDGPPFSLESVAVRWFSHARRRRSARRVKWAAVATYLATIGGTSFAPAFGWLALLSAVSALVAWLVEVASRTPRFTEGDSEPGSVAVEDGKLSVATKTETVTLDPTMVAAGWAEEPDHVVFELHDGRALSIRAESARKRQQLLRALGVSASDRVLRVPIYSRAGSIPSGEVLAAVAGVIFFPFTAIAWSSLSTAIWESVAGRLAAGAALPALLFILLAIGATTVPAWLLLLALRRRQAVVGADGIAIEGAWRRVIPFSQIENVELEESGAALALKNGKKVRLSTGRTDAMYPTVASDEQKSRARRLVERAREAVAASGQSRGLDQKAGWLASDERTPEAWRLHLEALGERVGDYRRPGISNEELLEIAKDAARTRDQRAAAMFLIAKRGADVRAARAAVDACADPELAQVLESALGGRLDRRATLAAPAAPRMRVATEEDVAAGSGPAEPDAATELPVARMTVRDSGSD